MRYLVIIVLAFFNSGCALFQKRVKTKVDDQLELKRETVLDQVAVKKGQKETNVYTYWPDGSVYQWENRIEQQNEAVLGRARVEEKAVAKKEGMQLESVPSISSIVILVVAIGVISMYLIYKS